MFNFQNQYTLVIRCRKAFFFWLDPKRSKKNQDATMLLPAYPRTSPPLRLAGAQVLKENSSRATARGRARTEWRKPGRVPGRHVGDEERACKARSVRAAFLFCSLSLGQAREKE
jgi:hypothetical protein